MEWCSSEGGSKNNRRGDTKIKALILSAGYGTRLKPITYFTPKTMIRINGMPVLEHNVNYLNFYGIKQIMVNTHHLSQQIMSYFGPRLLYSYEPELLGEDKTIESLKHWFDDYTLVMNGDTLTNLNIKEMFHYSKGRSIRYMDRGVYAGLKILSPEYFLGNKKIINYQDARAWWVDMGTFKGLEKAREILGNIKEDTPLN